VFDHVIKFKKYRRYKVLKWSSFGGFEWGLFAAKRKGKRKGRIKKKGR